MSGVILKKRAHGAPIAHPTTREKACSSCNRTFRLDEGKKFHLCPDCYRKLYLRQHRAKDGSVGSVGSARILTHITCANCGAQDYLNFVPEDREKALCKACFSEKALEPKRR